MSTLSAEIKNTQEKADVYIMKYTNKILEFAKTQMNKIYHISVVENGIRSTLCVTPSNKTNDCYSVSKLFTVTAIGLLFDEGKLNINERITDIFIEQLPPAMDPKWEEVTVDDVLLHRWGINHGFLDIDCEDINEYPGIYGERNDFLKIILSRQLSQTPGEYECYSDAAYYLLSRIVTEKSLETTYEYLRKRLFNPLQFEETAWSACPLGYSMGATGLFLRSCDMVKLGSLYLKSGIYKGERILSEAWCQTVIQRGYELRKCGNTGYAKGGMYGQCLYIDPGKNFAAAWLGYDKGGNREMLEFIKSLS